MKINRFIGDFDFTKSSVLTTDRGLINQLRNVLRIEIGTDVILGDGKGNEAVATLSRIDASTAVFEIQKVAKNKNEPRIKIILYAAILKHENFEFVVEKSTEVGVAEIQPIITDRTVKTGLRLDRLEKIAKEAAEQSG